MTKHKKKWKCSSKGCENTGGLYIYICYRHKPDQPKESLKIGRRTHVCYNHFMDWINQVMKEFSAHTMISTGI